MNWNNIELPDKPYYQDEAVVIYNADCLDILPAIHGASAVVTDPPYELGFMGKDWDKKGISFQSDTWRLISESCLPGAPLLSFGGTRTQHRITCAIEDAGWQIRDTIMWVYGSGFPKSHNLAGAIDKKLGYGDRGHRIAVASRYHPDGTLEPNGELLLPYEAKSPEAKLWEGYGTALKPAYEPIILAMKPLDGTFANNALKHKVAGLNIDECKLELQHESIPRLNKPYIRKGDNNFGGGKDKRQGKITGFESKGRFPANFIHDGSQEVMELFPNSKNNMGQNRNAHKGNKSSFGLPAPMEYQSYYGDSGSAARFFYCAKASRRERDAGLEDMPEKVGNSTWESRIRECKICGSRAKPSGMDYQTKDWPTCGHNEWEWEFELIQGHKGNARNSHPTVKPLALMTYLCKLVKMPEYNLILDPLCGSGTTLLACKKLGIPCIGIDNDEKSCEIAAKRCQNQK